VCRISVATYVELSMVIESQLGAEGMRQAEVFFRRASVVIEPVTVDHGELARQAFLEFGKGRHNAGPAIAFPTPWRRRRENRSCSRPPTSAGPI